MRDEMFEWDDAKAEANLKKHGVTFELARFVFEDAAAVEFDEDWDHSGEFRSRIIGVAGGVMLFVAYAQRNGRLRIISARRVVKNERQKYLERS